MAPVGTSESQDVHLSVAGRDLTARIDPLARTATFRMAEWDDSRDHKYQLSYTADSGGTQRRTWTFDGLVRRDPRDKPAIVVAAFTGNADPGFPHADVVRHVSTFEPDLLVFTGDQIYEAVGGFGVQRAPLDTAALDYLRKWFMFGWEYRDLLRRIPAVMLPDDHDVYHGNLWGAGGRDANDGPQALKIDNGGYTMPPAWVNAVQRTQTSHLPDPVDPEPVERGIGVYFTQLVWGGVSFAIVEDRKWKSAPAIALPAAQIVNGWAQNPDFDSAASGDVPGAQLLGPRQMRRHLADRHAQRRCHDEAADPAARRLCGRGDARPGPRFERVAAVAAQCRAAPLAPRKGRAHCRRSASRQHDPVRHRRVPRRAVRDLRAVGRQLLAPPVVSTSARRPPRGRAAAIHRRLPRWIRQQDDGARGLEPAHLQRRAARHQRSRARLRHHHVRSPDPSDHDGQLAPQRGSVGARREAIRRLAHHDSQR
jgi:hypothetical protein